MNDTAIRPHNGTYYCPSEGCSKQYTIFDSLRKHCIRSHKLRVYSYQKQNDEEKQKRRRNAINTWYNNKKAKNTRRNFTRKDADRNCGIVEYRKSSIPGAGNGVFALQDLQTGDILTR